MSDFDEPPRARDEMRLYLGQTRSVSDDFCRYPSWEGIAIQTVG